MLRGGRQDPSAQTGNGDRAVEMFIVGTDDQDRTGRVNGGRQELGNGRLGLDSGRLGLDSSVGGRVVGQARSWKQGSWKQGSRQAGRDSTTGGWSDRQGFGNRQDQL